MRPDDVVSIGVHVVVLRSGEGLNAKVAAECGVYLLHAVNIFSERQSQDMQTNITDWRWVLEQDNLLGTSIN